MKRLRQSKLSFGKEETGQAERKRKRESDGSQGGTAGATSEEDQKVNNEGEIEQRERVEDRESNEQEEDRETKEEGREGARYGKERDMEN
ncbi:hypothetical protein NQZ68_026282 [Dissostichus eleginoides]|nr:hypothetical protein NQZ68_026282 [Dissostichus eleginoides]